MAAEIVPFSRPGVTAAQHHGNEAELIRLPAQSHGLTGRDLNGIKGLMASTHGAWCCELVVVPRGVAALVVRDGLGSNEPRGYMVCRNGHWLTLFGAAPTLHWPALGRFDTLEGLLDALGQAIGSIAAP